MNCKLQRLVRFIGLRWYREILLPGMTKKGSGITAICLRCYRPLIGIGRNDRHLFCKSNAAGQTPAAGKDG